MTDDKEHIQIKPRWQDEWDTEWPPDFLRAFLAETLPSLEELEFYRCLPFLKRLGYDPEAVYTHLTYDVEEFTPTFEWFGEDVTSLEVDAAAARFPELSPYLVVNTHRCRQPDESFEAYIGNRGELLGIDKRVAMDYLKASGATYSVLLSNEYIVIARAEDADWLDGVTDVDNRVIAKRLADIDWDFAKELKQLLKQPDGLSIDARQPGQQATLQEEWSTGPERINTEYVDLELEVYQQAYRSVREAESNHEKKESLESLSDLLFESITVTAVKEKNFRGKTNEIDLVIENTGGNGFSLFDDYGQYVLVECKNWADPVSAKEIRDFAGKMEYTGVQLGILFARHGITGENTDADRLVEKFAQNGQYIVVIDGKDLERIGNGKSFYQIIEERLWRLRFDPLT